MSDGPARPDVAGDLQVPGAGHVTFQGRSVAELEKAFRKSVDDYLDFCRKRGQSPDKPASGRFIVRVDPRLHRRMNVLAAAAGKSLNSWIAETLQREAGPAARTVRSVRGRTRKGSAKASVRGTHSR